MKSQLSLFENKESVKEPKIELISRKNLEIIVGSNIFDASTATKIFTALTEKLLWKQDVIKMYGKEIPLPRLSSWYGDNDKPYTYSGITLQPHSWIPELLNVKQSIENLAKTTFTSVLANRYRNGSDYVSWHTDAEKELGSNPIIGSVNFGATRKFQLRRIDDHSEKIEIELTHGTMLVMMGETQHYWQHQVPKTSQKIGERINLTFRTMK